VSTQQEQVDIANELLKVMQSLNASVEKFAQASKSAASSMSEDMKTSLEEVSTQARETNRSQSELSSGLKETTEGVAGLDRALGLQAETSKSVTEATKSTSESIADLAKQGGFLAIAGSTVRESWEAVKSVFGLVGAGATGLFSIFKGGMSIVSGFFGSLFSAASQYYQKSSGEWFQANQAIVESFGDLRSNEGAFVKEMASDLKGAQDSLAGAGKSLYSTIGNGAAILKEATALAQGFGNSLTSLTDQIKGAADEMFLMSKGMNMSADSLKQIAKNAKMTGGSFEESMQNMMVATAHLSKKFGVSVKVIGKNLNELTKDFETFGHLSEKELAATSVYAAKLGVEINALKGVMDKFDSFEGAAQAAGKLNEAFGMNIDTMKMMNEENPAARMDMLRQSLADTGKSFEDLSRHEKKLMAQTTGMDMGSLQAAMSIDPDEMGFDDAMDAAEEAAEKMSPEDAMIEVSKSIKDLQRSMTTLAEGPLAAFMQGFTKAIELSPQFRELMKITSNFLLVFRTMGLEVGKIFLEKFEKPLEKIMQYFRDLFSVDRIKEFSSEIKAALGNFFEQLQNPDADMAEVGYNLMQQLWESVEKWLTGGPNAEGLGDALKEWIEKGIRALGGAIKFIVEKAAEYITDLTVKIKEWLAKAPAPKGALRDGIGGALIDSIGMIYDTFKSQLWPALKDLFWTLFDEYKWDLAKVLGVVIGFVIVKAVLAAMITAAASSLIAGGISGFGDSIKKMISGLGFGMVTGSAEEQATQGLEESGGIVESMTSKIADMSAGDIGKATINMGLLAGLLATALVMVAAVGALAWGFQKAGIEVTMLLGVSAALLLVSISMAKLIDATREITVEQVAAVGLIFLAAAGLFWLTATELTPALKNMGDILATVNFVGVLKGLGALILTVGSIGLLALAAAKLKEEVGGYVALMGAAAILAAAIEMFRRLVDGGFANVVQNFAKQLDGFNGLRFAANMVGLTVGMAAFAIGVVAIGAAAVAGIAAWGAYWLADQAGVWGDSDTKLGGIWGAIHSMGTRATAAFDWVSVASVTKIVVGLALFTLVLYGLKKMYDSFGGWGSLGIAAVGGIAAYLLKSTDIFGSGEAKTASASDGGMVDSVKSVTDAIANIGIVNIGEMEQKIKLIKEVVEVTQSLGEFAMRSASLTAKIMESGALTDTEKKGGIGGMMTTMAGFIGKIASSMTDVVMEVVNLAEQIKAKTGGVGPGIGMGTGPLDKEIKMVLAIMKATVALGVGMMKPFQEAQKNTTYFESLAGEGASGTITAMSKGVTNVMKTMAHKEHGLAVIVKQLLDIVPAGTNIEELYIKALAIEAIFNGILAVSEATQIIHELSKKEGYFSEGGAEKLNTIMTTIAGFFGVGMPDGNMMKTMFNAFHNTFFGNDPAKFTVNKKIGILARDTLSNIKMVSKWLKEKIYDDVLIHLDAVNMLSEIASSYDEMYEGNYLPSQVLGTVLYDALMMKETLDMNYVDLSSDIAKLDMYTDFFLALPKMFEAYNAALIGSSLPADLVVKIGKEAKELANSMNLIEADLGEVQLNPVTKALLGAGETKEFIVRPDNMTLQIKLQVNMEAKKIADAIVECQPDVDGYFEQTQKSKSLLGAENIGGGATQ